MPLLSAAMREMNYHRIQRLRRTLSDHTCAAILTDESGGEDQYTAEMVRAYCSLQEKASKKMLASKKTMDAIENGDKPSEQPDSEK